LASSVGDLAMVPPGSPRETPMAEGPTLGVWEAPTQVMLGADGASIGTTSVEVDGAAP
jgi:hypothetical protein